MRWVVAAETQLSQDPHPWVGDPQTGEISQLQRFSPRNKQPQAHTGLLGQGSCTRNTNPQNVWLWKLVGLKFGSQSTIRYTCTCKTSHVLSPNAEAVIGKKPGSDPLADLGDPARGTGGNWDSPGDEDTGGSHIGEFIVPQWCQHWRMPFWNLPSSLLVPEAYSPTNKPALASHPSGACRQPRSNMAPSASRPSVDGGRLEPGFSLLEWVVIDKQGTRSRMIHAVMESETSTCHSVHCSSIYNSQDMEAT